MSKENTTKTQKLRIKKVFEKCLKNIDDGNDPNVSGEMRKAGYTDSSAHSLKVTQSKTWKELLNEVNNHEIRDVLVEIMRDKNDKRARLDSIDKLAKLKGLYPDKKVSLGIFDEREEVFE